MNAAAMVSRCERHQINDYGSLLTHEQEREIRGAGDVQIPEHQQILPDPERMTLFCEDVLDMAWD